MAHWVKACAPQPDVETGPRAEPLTHRQVGGGELPQQLPLRGRTTHNLQTVVRVFSPTCNQM